MGKLEFLNILRQALDREVSTEVIERNVHYYDQYIGNRSGEEERKVIDQLGDPRLLAKTIIETEKMAKQKEINKDNQGYQSNYYNEGETMNGDKQYKTPYGKNIFFSKLTWYHKFIITFVIVFILVLLVILGRILIAILFTFGFPLIIIFFLLMLFRKR